MPSSILTVWRELQPPPASALLGPEFTVTSSPGGVLEIFAFGSDGAVWHSWQSSAGAASWMPWMSLGAPPKGVLRGQLPVAGDTGGSTQVFVLDNNQSVWAIAHHDDDPTAVGTWQNLGAPAGAANPAVALGTSAGTQINSVDVFVVGGDGAIWTIWPDSTTASGWSAWQSVQFAAEGGQMPYAVAANQDGRLELFCIPQDLQVWHVWLEPVWQPPSTWLNPSGVSGWSNWTPVPAAAGTGPVIDSACAVTCGVDGKGDLEIYLVDHNGGLWGRSQTKVNTQSAWSNWNQVTGPPFRLPQSERGISIASNPDGREEMFALDPQGHIWHTFNPNSGNPAATGLQAPWQTWTQLGELSFTSFATARDLDGRIEVFGCSSDLSSMWNLAQTAPNDDSFAPPPSLFPGSARDLVKDGAWFRDAAGRFVLFRGVNFAARSKHPPYVPELPLTVTSLPAPGTVVPSIPNVSQLMQNLKTWGFNVVRLLVLWKGVEPMPATVPGPLWVAGEAYLNALKQVVDQLFAMGIFVIVDFHQDIAHESYNGDGFPDWAIQVDATHPQPTPDFQDSSWGLRYYDYHAVGWPFANQNNVLVRVSLNAFWQNSTSNALHNLTNFPVQSHLVNSIGQTAQFFMNATVGIAVTESGGGKPMFNPAVGHPGILGYEFFNEPHPVGQGKAQFEQNILPPFYNKARAAVRQSDQNAFLFVEPRMDWTTYPFPEPEFQGIGFVRQGSDVQSFLDFSDPAVQGKNDRCVFSFHHYDPWTIFYADLPLGGQPDSMENKDKEWPGIYGALIGAATSRALIPFLTEFGGSHDWTYSTDLRPDVYGTQIRAYLDLAFGQIEANLLNAALWVYDLCNTATLKDNWNLENFSLLGPGGTPRESDIVVRPYPLRSSAKPSRLFFDIGSKHCAIILQGEVVEAPTVIYVPTIVQYQTGFEVRATSSDVRWQSADQHLLWFPDPNSDLNQIVLCPPGSFSASALPPESLQQALFNDTVLVGTFPGSNVVQTE